MRAAGRTGLFIIVGMTGCGRVSFDPASDCQLGATQDPYAAGDGLSKDTAFLICTERQLRAVAERPEDRQSTFRLGADLDLTGRTALMIGSEAAPFEGVFLGGGFSIKGLTLEIDAPEVGLFARTRNASVTDLVLRNIAVAARGTFVGGLIGLAESELVLQNVEVSGTIENRDPMSIAGGLVGLLDCEHFNGHRCMALRIGDLVANVDVLGGGSAGGIFGEIYFYPEDNSSLLAITNVAVAGTVRGVNGVAGIVGYAEHTHVSNARIDASLFAQQGAGGVYGSTTFFSTTVSGATMNGDVECTNGGCGGILGDSEGGATDIVVNGSVRCGGDTCGGAAGVIGGTLERVVVHGAVSGRDQIGGLGGNLYSRSIVDSYSDGTVTGRNQVGGLVGEIGSTVAALAGVFRSYSTASVAGESSVGGLVGDLVNEGTLRDSFGAGVVAGNSPAGAVSLLVGVVSGTLDSTGNYFAQDSICANTSGACGPLGTAAMRSQFFARTNAPLDRWDFTNVWREVVGATPQLSIEP